ncbi:MAG: tRNA (guanosine(46)-N7)-methyltransferase TrmB [Bacteroidales bacterium]|jgi:tRNA (guanine-N7-)-methyltransferase|nr:tRNA (guanosine(46)-N7)-methyltransferase TrmB [Bacteroidales bacterium]MBO7256242.1 tRNA (guanosine(46)-N7)-methyltransferase TrmB [Bacteroidales bacterium]MBO7284872.1 tRNA (guanosine(46)-N7)-methyltransferase TrmB [Bacteroidales bacterium]MBO7322845.1 tRNA (guanosine(46)-N7)-methyltransferase TrmB [Bacteroidales bacterium]MBQ1280033.1 tRNA (guanosine(46)-N7)-methyltransferase TrmB [Bacteroidales bacterium]
MSGKDKLRKFRENETFENLLQPTTAEVFQKDHPMKGNWGEKMFGNNNPIILELGCGKGEYTIALAEKFPQNNYIGVDIKGARLWKGAKYATEKSLKNVAFLRTRIEFIDSIFAQGEVSEIWLTFSDPQPNKPRKRLSSPLFLERYSHILKEDGIIHLKTDSQLLHEYTLETIESENHILLEANNDIYGTNRAENDDILSVKTFYEKQFLAKGMAITYAKWRLRK